MSQEDDQRLQHILKQTEARRRAEEQQQEFDRQHREAEAKQRESAKPKIEEFLDRLHSVAGVVSQELAPAAVMIEVEAVRLSRDNEIAARIRAKPLAAGSRAEMVELVISDKGYVRGSEFFTGDKTRNGTVNEFTIAVIRTAYLKLAERALHIKPFK